MASEGVSSLNGYLQIRKVARISNIGSLRNGMLPAKTTYRRLHRKDGVDVAANAVGGST